VEEFKYLVTTLKTKILCRKNLKQAQVRECLLSFGSESFVFHLSKNLKVEIYRTVIKPVVFSWCEIWLLTLWKERSLRVFAKRVLRRTFGPKRNEVTGNGENYLMRNLMFCTHTILFG